jgi:hypothetical protein
MGLKDKLRERAERGRQQATAQQQQVQAAQEAFYTRERARASYQVETMWQYHVEVVTITERWFGSQQTEVLSMRQRLDALGEQGWEMVSFDIVPLVGSITGNVKGNVYLTFFKRPLPREARGA